MKANVPTQPAARRAYLRRLMNSARGIQATADQLLTMQYANALAAHWETLNARNPAHHAKLARHTAKILDQAAAQLENSHPSAAPETIAMAINRAFAQLSGQRRWAWWLALPEPCEK